MSRIRHKVLRICKFRRESTTLRNAITEVITRRKRSAYATEGTSSQRVPPRNDPDPIPCLLYSSRVGRARRSKTNACVAKCPEFANTSERLKPSAVRALRPLMAASLRSVPPRAPLCKERHQRPTRIRSNAPHALGPKQPNSYKAFLGLRRSSQTVHHGLPRPPKVLQRHPPHISEPFQSLPRAPKAFQGLLRASQALHHDLPRLRMSSNVFPCLRRSSTIFRSLPRSFHGLPRLRSNSPVFQDLQRSSRVFRSLPRSSTVFRYLEVIRLSSKTFQGPPRSSVAVQGHLRPSATSFRGFPS